HAAARHEVGDLDLVGHGCSQLLYGFRYAPECRSLRPSGYHLPDVVCSSRSASQTLIMDCRVTPSRPASRSRDSIIQVGKSTFTLFCSWSGRRALLTSRAAVMSLSSSKSASNFLAFIQCYLFRPGAANGNDTNPLATVCYDRRPVLAAQASNHQKPGLIELKGEHGVKNILLLT